MVPSFDQLCCSQVKDRLNLRNFSLLRKFFFCFSFYSLFFRDNLFVRLIIHRRDWKIVAIFLFGLSTLKEMILEKKFMWKSTKGFYLCSFNMNYNAAFSTKIQSWRCFNALFTTVFF